MNSHAELQLDKKILFGHVFGENNGWEKWLLNKK